MAVAVAALTDWLLEQALIAAPLEALLPAVAERARRLGLPVWRFQLSATMLHPQFESLSYVWRPATGLEAESHPHGAMAHRRFQESPLKRMVAEGHGFMRHRLERGEGCDAFPVLREFRDEGATDWVALLTAFGVGGLVAPMPARGFVVSWATDRAGGFSDDEVAALERIQPALGVAVRTAVLLHMSEAILTAYIGGDAGRRVLDGEVRRGVVAKLDAAILLADLRGFTALADRLPGDLLVALLDDYLDLMAGAVHRRGGQVLKFMGDAMLATFALDGRPAAEVAAAALAAATEALARVDAFNRVRAGAGEPVMTLDVALHLGEVLYGNVGSNERLDFTMIGPAVNEASRIEALCAELGCPLLMSGSFVAALGGADRFRSVGRHRLRGVRAERELFTVPEPVAAAAASG